MPGDATNKYNEHGIGICLVGDFNNRYGRYLVKTYKDKRIIFLGKIYDERELNNLRYFSSLYFHGHSAGGTNPSLLEAMATSCVICAHNNEFNKSVLDSDAYYFKTKNDISKILNIEKDKSAKANWIENNLDKLRTKYNMDYIINTYPNQSYLYH